MWIFDLDNTLYPPETGLLEAVDRNIARYIAGRLRIGLDEAQTLRRRLWQTYGTTARGLREELGWTADDYFANIYIDDLGPYLRENPRLREALRAVPVPKSIFTNGHERHARRVLEALGVAACFDHLVALPEDLVGKPDPAAFARLARVVGRPLEGCVILDDEPRILAAARGLGMLTVYVGRRAGVDADQTIPSIEQLPDLASRLL